MTDSQSLTDVESIVYRQGILFLYISRLVELIENQEDKELHTRQLVMNPADRSSADSNTFTRTANLINPDERLIVFTRSPPTSFEQVFVLGIKRFIGVCHEKGPLLMWE